MMPRTADRIAVEIIKRTLTGRLRVEERVHRLARAVRVFHDHITLRVHRRVILTVGQGAHLAHRCLLAEMTIHNGLQINRLGACLSERSPGERERHKQCQCPSSHVFILILYCPHLLATGKGSTKKQGNLRGQARRAPFFVKFAP